MTNIEEIWKDVVGYEGKYQVSNLGNVKTLSRVVKAGMGLCRTIDDRLLTKNLHKRGYYFIKFGDRSYRALHRIVATAFIPNPQSKPCVNHIDGNKINNVSSNLEWCTYSENSIHSYDVLGHKSSNSKPTAQYENNKIINVFESISCAAMYLGFSTAFISLICSGKRHNKDLDIRILTIDKFEQIKSSGSSKINSL